MEVSGEKATKNNNLKKKGSHQRGKVFIDEERCKGCKICIEFCPTKVLGISLRFNKKGYHPPEILYPERCTGCDICGMMCPDFAIFGIRIKQDFDVDREEEKL